MNYLALRHKTPLNRTRCICIQPCILPPVAQNVRTVRGKPLIKPYYMNFYPSF
ncbi:hypothetical protein MRBBS_0926 [Marinobacter sp. BSs20148]|nr:hypothetical protein MRBBS_0926 [Marinobacter sp. BSs20148]